IRTNVVTQLESEGAIPEGISLTLTGTAGKLDLAKERFAWILALAVLISFLLMSALFEDFIAPIAVLVTVPLAAAGGLGGLWAVDRYLGQQPLDMLTFLGFIILIGVVVNNAILIVDGSIARLKSGEALDRAIVQSVESRVRPIFMSALTTLAGLLPLVVATGSGSELYRGIGSVVLGGLTLSTLLTLYVVPVLFATLWRIRSRFVARTP
ncbi:MAG: efflux RND transporter permease subunit, partial [Myxococcota bacterium]